MTRKTSILALFVFAVWLIPRVSFASTVLLTLKSSDGSPYDFSINGSSKLVDLSCLNDQRSVTMGQSWWATAVNLQTLISGNSDSTKIDGISIGQLKEDAYLDSQYTSIDNSITNTEIQDAIWSVLDGSYVYTGLSTSGSSKTAQDAAVQSLVAAAQSSKGTSSFYSQFTYYYPQYWGNNNDPSHKPQQFLGYCAVTPEPSSLILLGTGIAGLAGAMRRRLKASKHT